MKYELCPEHDPAEPLIHIMCQQLGAFTDEEIYGSGDHLTKEPQKRA